MIVNNVIHGEYWMPLMNKLVQHGSEYLINCFEFLFNIYVILYLYCIPNASIKQFKFAI